MLRPKPKEATVGDSQVGTRRGKFLTMADEVLALHINFPKKGCWLY